MSDDGSAHVVERDAMSALTREQLDHAIQAYNEEVQRVDIGPTTDELIGPFTIVCLVMNRTIGSGIFETPPKVLSGTGSVGGALMTWFGAGLIALCGVLCWLELGLSVPYHGITDPNGVWTRVSTPRSGGEKNYLEYIFKRPVFFMPCIFGILFILMGSLAGNAIAFGINILVMAGRDPLSLDNPNMEKGPVIGIAIAILTICPLIHIMSRKGGIWINNTFAILKVGILLAIIILGWIHSAGGLQRAPGAISEMPRDKNFTDPAVTGSTINAAAKTNFNTATSFNTAESRAGDIGSAVQALLFAIYPYTGFEQPFYVLSEVRNPRKIFPAATIGAMVLTIVLYMLINISYLCVIPQETYTSITANKMDMAGTFFYYLFDNTTIGSDVPGTGRRVIAGLKAFCIIGNMLVLTYTAARVKQEIAKEGILPQSLFFATSHTTPLAKLFSRNPGPAVHLGPNAGTVDLDRHLEQSPMAALALHWFSSLCIIAVTSGMSPSAQYSFLISLYSYTIVAVLGVLSAGGLVYLKLDSYFRGEAGRRWHEKSAWPPREQPWMRKLSWVYAVVYAVAMLFVLFASFVSTGAGGPFSAKVLGYSPKEAAGIGLSSVLWGVLWWLGLEFWQWKGGFRLVVSRVPYIEPDGEGGYVQRAELVDHEQVVDVEVRRIPVSDFVVDNKD
jgi:amino acid transporter